MYTPYCEYFTANLIYVYCMDPKTYWFLVGNSIHDYWKKQRVFFLSHVYGYICSMRNFFVLMLQVRIIFRYDSSLINACNVQISNNFMYYFSSSMIFLWHKLPIFSNIWKKISKFYCFEKHYWRYKLLCINVHGTPIK